MANKLTRKGLAGAVALALVTVGLSAAPASANSVTLAIEAGTGTTGILGDSFYVKASLGSNLTSTANARLKFAVTNSTGAALTYLHDASATTGDRTSYAAEGTIQVDAANGTTSSGTADVVSSTGGTPASIHVLGISSAATAAHSVSVVAFVDDNLNGINDDAFVSSSITINFVTLANAGLTLNLTAPQIGESALSATVTSTVVNIYQVDAGDYSVQFGYYNAGVATTLHGSQTWAAPAAEGNITATTAATSTRASLAATLSSLASHGGGTVVKEELTYIARLWSDQTTTFAALSGIVSSAVAKAVVNAGQSEAYWVENANVTPAGVIRPGTTSATLEVAVANVRGVALAGKVVVLTVASVAGTHTINGVAASATTYRATTNASGVATFAIASTTAVATNNITFTSITSDGVSIASPGNAAWTALVYRVVQEVQTATTDVQRFAATGGSYTANVIVVDNWNQRLTSADFRIKYQLSDRTVATAFDSLSDGVASVAIADGSVGSGSSTTAKFSLEKLTSGSWAAHTDSAVVDMDGESDENNALVINWATATPVITLNADGTSSADLSVYAGLSPARAGNTITSHYAETTIDSTPDEGALITGTVRTNLGASMNGGLVTVSGDSSILFRVGTASGLGSLSFHTADGNLSIVAYSNKIQTSSVVTVTVGSVSSTVRLTFLGSRTDVGRSITIDAPSTVEPGSTLQAIVRVVDRYGNGIDTDITATDFDGSGGAAVKADGEDDADFRMTVTGPGISLTTLPTGTTNGSAIVNRLLGSKDSGTIVITVTYGGADAVIGTGDDDITATKSITVGALAAAPSTGKVNVGSFNGKLVVYASGLDGKRISWKVGGNWGKATAVGNTLNRFDRPTPRRGVTLNVEIFVDGVSTLKKSVVTR